MAGNTVKFIMWRYDNNQTVKIWHPSSLIRLICILKTWDASRKVSFSSACLRAVSCLFFLHCHMLQGSSVMLSNQDLVRFLLLIEAYQSTFRFFQWRQGSFHMNWLARSDTKCSVNPRISFLIITFTIRTQTSYGT